MVIDLMQCDNCGKVISLEYCIIVRTFKNGVNIETNMYCNKECMIKHLNSKK